MDNISKLEKLLDMYIEKDKQNKRTYQDKLIKKDLYEELFNLFSSDYDEMKDNSLPIGILFNSIYNNDIYYQEFYRLVLKARVDKIGKSELKHLINTIKNDYNHLLEDISSLEKQINANRSVVSSANRVKLSFKYHSSIDGKYDVYAVKRIISYFELSGLISNKEELLLINEIELYNRKVSLDNNKDIQENTYAENLYEQIPNILLAGFQPCDIVQVSPNIKDTLDSFVKQIITSITDLSEEEVIEVIEGYKKYNLSDNEYNYIVTRILDSYQEDLLVYYNLLLDKDVYTKRKERLIVIKDYYSILDKYLYLSDYYDKISEEVSSYDDTPDTLSEEELLTKDTPRRLIYSRSLVNPLKSYVVEDMDSIPNEYYNTIKELLYDFKNNVISLKKTKRLADSSGKLTSSRELLDDQVRIVLRHVSNDIYCIMGVFAKKSNNERAIYERLKNRTIPDISNEELLTKQLELSNYTEGELTSLIEEKGRKGTR